MLPSTLLSLLVVATATATPAAAARHLSLDECLQAAVAKNPGLASSRLDAAIGRLGYEQASHSYGLALKVGPSLERSLRPTSETFLSGGVSRLDEWHQNYNMALEQSLATGGSVGLRFSQNVFDTNSNRVDFNPSFTPGLSLSLSQPLLRDFWSGGRAIAVARLDARTAELQADAALLNLLAETEGAYWQLVAAREEIRVREQSLQLVKNLLAINREKAAAGLLARLDVLQAEASLAVRESALLESQRNLAQATDRLRKLIDPGFTEAEWQRPILPTDKPQFVKREATFDASWALANAHRPDLAEAELALERQRTALDTAANKLWPRLDVSGQAGVTNLDRSLDAAIGALPRSQNFNLEAAVALSWPLGPSAERDEYEAAKLRYEKATLGLSTAKQKAFVEVREAVRDVQIDAKRVEATRLAKKLADAKLDAEQEKLKAGLSTNFQVLEFQKDFEEAALAEVVATIDYLQALTRLERAQGTLVAARGLATTDDEPGYSVK